jgi:DNA-binding MarR family transcriptional regulator
MSRLTRQGGLLTEIVLEVFRLNRLLLDAGDALTAPVGLTSARWQVLGIVEHGPAPVAQVARAMGLTRQSVQETANGLAAEGFIEFVRNPRHRRAKLLVMTPKGRSAMAVVRRRHASWANELGGRHQAAALEPVVSVLSEIRATLEESVASASAPEVAS